ncbi:MAG: hypothetical protein ACYDEP_10575 [Acidimicrobiales bacterium]
MATSIDDPGLWTPLPLFERRRRFWISLVAIALIALIVRVLYAALWGWHLTNAFNDVFFYRGVAHSLAQGMGFQNTYLINPSAHPPMFPIVLSLTYFAKLSTYGEQLIFVAVIETVTVVVVGLVGAQIQGERVGLLAAAIGAIYPGFWLPGSQVMSEPLAMLVVAVLTAVTYAFVRRPTTIRAVGIGVLCAVAALTRSELILLVPLVAWPIIWFRRTIATPTRLRMIAIATVAALFVVTPWTAFISAVHRKPELLSTQMGATLAWSNCMYTYSGPLVGYWSGACIAPAYGQPFPGNAALTSQAESYAFSHISGWPFVIFAREGRVWGFYRPAQQAQLNHNNDHWNLGVAQAETWCLYLVIAFGVVGTVALRRRRVPLSPLLGVVLLVVITVGLFYGDPRFRASSEVALVLLAAVGLDTVAAAAVGALSTKATRTTDPTPAA